MPRQLIQGEGNAAFLVHVIRKVAGSLWAATKSTKIGYSVWYNWLHGAVPSLDTLGAVYAQYPAAWDELDTALLACVRLYAQEANDGAETT